MNSHPALSVDFRTDATTLPTAEMWDAMRGADLGWASAGEDRLTRELEDAAARLSGKQSALFVLTGHMANLTALMSHGERGSQVILEASSHILWCEEWGMSYVAGLIPRPVSGSRGKLAADAIVDAVEASLYRHRPRTSLLCLENTDNIFGAALASADIAEPAEAAHSLGLSVHVDGARIFNACVALDAALAELLEPVDSATIGINKGLSAPGGALLVGSSEFIERCRVNLRRIGGTSYHQAGIYAAAALVALDTMIPRLREDHARAQMLATLLAPLPGLGVDAAEVETNIVVVKIAPALGASDEFVAELAARGVGCYVSGPESVRFVTHRHLGDGDITRAAAVVGQFVQRAGSDHQISAIDVE
jgi:threonine aldolase